MRNFQPETKQQMVGYITVFALVCCAVLTLPKLLNARAVGMVVTVTNNTGRGISHIYLSAPENDNWGPDQLDNTVLGPGQAVTLGNVVCNGSGVKVVAEDRDGCFVYKVLSCSATGTWGISSDAVPDCGN
jgi:hypothetical protein